MGRMLVMARITISIPDDLAAKADRAVEAGLAPSVSSWFAALARREPDWAAAETVLAELATEAGVTDADREEAAAALDAAAAADHLGGAA